MTDSPILYSFRRCPYAICARLALALAGVSYELREVDLKQKPKELLQLNNQATVPVLHYQDLVITESYDIVTWALQQHYPASFMPFTKIDKQLSARSLIEIKSSFIYHLNRLKYSNRYLDVDINLHTRYLKSYITYFNNTISDNSFLLGSSPCYVDLLWWPFFRQLNIASATLFSSTATPVLFHWFSFWQLELQRLHIMEKYPLWSTGTPPIIISHNNT